MICLDEYCIHLYKGFVDFRKSIDGLYAIVDSDTTIDIFEKHLFIFSNKSKDKVKILYWDKTGFVMWYKRLEKGRFKWSTKARDEVIKLSREEFIWLLRGIDILKIKAHKEIFYQKAE